MTGGPVKVLIVDDAPIVRNVLTKELSRDARIEVVGAAEDAYQARDMIIERNPDVISLDLLMPRMDGLEFMEVLMKHWPMPIIVLSSIVDDHWDQALRALELGAIEVFAKPNPEDPVAFKAMLARLTDTLVWAARIDMNEVLQKKKDPEQTKSSEIPLSSKGCRQDNCNWCFNRWGRSFAKYYSTVTPNNAGYIDCPAHAGALHTFLCTAT